MHKGILATAAAVAMGVSSLAMAAGTVTFGVQAPITGKYANEGQGIEKAVKLLAKEQNAKGGLLGKQIKVQACDDEGKATQAALCARRLTNAGVFAVIGSYTSGAASAAQPIYARANVIQTSDGTADELTQRGFKTFFRNAPPNSAEAKFTGEYLVNHKHYQRIAVISDHSSFSKGLGDAVAEAIKSDGGQVLTRAYINSGSQDFTSVLTDIKSKNPDVIYFSGYYSDGGLLRSQEKQLGMNVPFVGGDANQNVAFAKIAGDAAQGSIIVNVPAPENLPYKAAKEFLAAYQKAYGEAPPSIFTLTNADGMRVVMKAVEETHSLNPKKVEAYLHQKIDKFPGITGPISFSSKGERIGSAFQAFEVQADGSYKTVYPTSASAS
ncbi:branched-chain amino acid ABC transporter substrate-binding protein [Salinisphaera sp. LB1]|uniref:branched-chain amino acid ABC transporter substrate-binding protein n=1 Tax=Salinisphaera sp. LB1 TaxID=2183911 RepID=UPI000D708918|nr:branched-chain amino acid ABC transporter substrate-binding protein [Salinisphaera sp. LB1]AWN15544.1 Branched-chain amino acid ABC transporter, amino acid-binding protein [Salinisphaera sp. LB1]